MSDREPGERAKDIRRSSAASSAPPSAGRKRDAVCSRPGPRPRAGRSPAGRSRGRPRRATGRCPRTRTRDARPAIGPAARERGSRRAHRDRGSAVAAPRATGSAVPDDVADQARSEDAGRDARGVLVAASRRRPDRPAAPAPPRPRRGACPRRRSRGAASSPRLRRIEAERARAAPRTTRRSRRRAAGARGVRRIERPAGRSAGDDQERRRQQVAVGTRVEMRPGARRSSARHATGRRSRRVTLRIARRSDAVAALLELGAPLAGPSRSGAGPRGRFASVDRDDPVDLRGDADGRGEIPPGHSLADRPSSRGRPRARREPVVGILLCPARARVSASCGTPARPGRSRPGVVEEDRLRRLGPDVAPDDEDGRTSCGTSRNMTHRTNRQAAASTRRRATGNVAPAPTPRSRQPTGPGPRR